MDDRLFSAEGQKVSVISLMMSTFFRHSLNFAKALCATHLWDLQGPLVALRTWMIKELDVNRITQRLTNVAHSNGDYGIWRPC